MKGQISLQQLPPVRRGISWEALFGRSISDLTIEDRRARWARVLELARSAKERNEMRFYWMSGEGCHCDKRGTCVHLNDGWCELQGLPSSFNPYLKDLGMACMGLSFTPAKERRRA